MLSVLTLQIHCRGMEGVEQVYGRRSSFDIPAAFVDVSDGTCTIDLISFDEFDLEGLQKMVRSDEAEI